MASCDKAFPAKLAEATQNKPRRFTRNGQKAMMVANQASLVCRRKMCLKRTKQFGFL
jgi:hypothetical protein